MADLEAELDCLMTRAGITVPDDRRASILAAFADLRGQIALLHVRRSHLVEPSNIFTLVPPDSAA